MREQNDVFLMVCHIHLHSVLSLIPIEEMLDSGRNPIQNIWQSRNTPRTLDSRYIREFPSLRLAISFETSVRQVTECASKGF